MSVRAGIVVTGTEVLTGVISDRNGPWLSERLRERGVDVAHIDVVGDRPEDLRAALDFMAAQGFDLVVTSGGLGPTADDLTTAVVAEWAGREMRLDPALEEHIWGLVTRLRSAQWQFREGPMREGARKQAVVPDGAHVLMPVGTAPGVVVSPAAGSGPVVVVLPGPPGELQPMWEDALAGASELAAVLGRAGEIEQRMLRLYGLPEAEIAQTLRDVEDSGVEVGRLEITTCLRRGELEIATAFAPDAAPVYDALEAVIRERHGERIFSSDKRTIDEIVASLFVEAGATVATAESCTGGLMAGRLTDRAGSSAYVLGGVVAYANEAKVALAGVDPALIERVGAVSPEVARALCAGARERFGATVGIGITGIAGPGGAVEGKPVGTVCLCVGGEGSEIERDVRLPGSRANVRDRTTTIVMHDLRTWLLSHPG